jgi:hypothetical protein
MNEQSWIDLYRGPLTAVLVVAVVIIGGWIVGRMMDGPPPTAPS